MTDIVAAHTGCEMQGVVQDLEVAASYREAEVKPASAMRRVSIKTVGHLDSRQIQAEDVRDEKRTETDAHWTEID